MMFSKQTLMQLVAATTVFAIPADIRSQDTINEYAPHGNQGASVNNPGPFPADAVAISRKCIKFTSDDPQWHFTNTGVWGTKSGSFANNGGEICVPTDDGAGGAMYIGPDANPGAGNTKLECFFPTKGKGNCDISLVDGYSLSVTCKVGAKTVGGPVDLWKHGHCAHKQGSVCNNTMGYAPSQSDVGGFFQPAVKDGNHYCIWVNCAEDYYLPADGEVACHVSGTAA